MASKTTQKIVITGSSGYVGQHLITKLATHGIAGNSPSCQYEIYCAYNSLPTFEKDLHDLCQSIKMHPSISKMEAFTLDFQGDIAANIHRVAGESIDVIIHLAALSSPFYCQNHPAEAWSINVPIGLLACNAPIVYMSTDQVYNGSKQFYNEDDDDTIPVNLYGVTKLAFERILLLSSKIDADKSKANAGPLLTKEELGEFTLPQHLSPSNIINPSSHPSSVILRSSLILGKPTPFKNGCKKGTFPSFLQFVESRLKSCTPTDFFTNEYRSVVHIEDVLSAIIHFTRQALDTTQNAPTTVRIYNLGGRERVSRYELALQMASYLKLDKGCVKGVQREEGGGGGVPSPPDISMNVDKITKELGVDRLDGLDEIIRATFDG